MEASRCARGRANDQRSSFAKREDEFDFPDALRESLGNFYGGEAVIGEPIDVLARLIDKFGLDARFRARRIDARRRIGASGQLGDALVSLLDQDFQSCGFLIQMSRESPDEFFGFDDGRFD